ncbi:hypothetical protein [Desulfosporosinus sp. OT]|uniref:hypothetical protein n=1 Tax=Desulfosporosinus sp. OT TaxID=913865 RepID=UPI000223A903|nr:hypothetical protein [Desulfosporosinus sp. OT]EGW39061.1 hypothetical protein DOT_3012 [Desulfosporosinus sp. OT]
MGTNLKPKEETFDNEFSNPEDAKTEVKVSDDEGQTWQRRKISMVAGLDESGLNPGEIFQLNGEKFLVLAGEDGMAVEQIKKPERQKSAIEKKPVKRRG